MVEPLSTSQKEKSNSFSVFRGIYQIGKKFIDDEIWYIVRNILPSGLSKALNPFMVGVLIFLGIAQELYASIEDIYYAVKEKNKQLKSRIAAGAIVIGLSAVGTVLIAALIASALGVAVTGAALIAVSLPAIMLSIYTVNLARDIYALRMARQKEQQAKISYENFINDHLENLKLLKTQKAQLEEQRNAIYKVMRGESHGVVDPDELHCLDDSINELNEQISVIEIAKEEKKAAYESANEERLTAERAVAFGTAEVATSLIVLGSAVLGFILATALIGGSIATLGVLPTVLVVFTATVSAGFKLFELIDEKNDHVYSKKLRKLIFGESRPILDAEKNLNEIQLIDNLNSQADSVDSLQGSTSKIMKLMPPQPQLIKTNTFMDNMDEDKEDKPEFELREMNNNPFSEPNSPPEFGQELGARMRCT